MKNNKINTENTKLKKQLYIEYSNLYGNLLSEKELTAIINVCVDSYSYDEFLNEKLSAKFKIDGVITKKLSEKYKENIDNEVGLEIAIKIENLYLNKIKQRYPNLDLTKISEAISKTLETYDGQKTFFIETVLNIKKGK